MRLLGSTGNLCLNASSLRFATCGLALLSLQVFPFCTVKGQTESAKRPITVKDTIEMTEFADRNYFLGGAPDFPVAIFSPDRKQFLVRLKKGDVERNVVKYWLLLFHTADAFDSPQGRVLVTMSSSSNREAIQQVRWLGNRTVLFLGENPGGIPQVYRLDVLRGQLAQLTHHPTPVVSYDASRNGRELVYEAVPRPKRRLETKEVRRHGWLVTSQDVDELMRAEENSQEDSSVDRELYVQSGRGKPEQVRSPDFLTEYLPLVVSPDGRYGVIAAYLGNIPEKWAEYEDKVLHPYIVERRKPGAMSNVEQYMLLDTRKKSLTPLLNAPKAWLDEGIVWLGAGNSVVVSGAYLPLDSRDAEALAARRKHPFVVEIDIPSGDTHEITGSPLRLTHLDEQREELTLATGYGVSKGPLQSARKVDGRWQVMPTPSDGIVDAPVRVTLEENSNTPPRIFVNNQRTGEKRLLLDLNPQFRNFQFAKVETIRWLATDGHEVEGGLYFPSDYQRGKRYPLVIQTHGYEEDRFWMNGPWNSAFAAQPLAAQGILVLQVGDATEQGSDRRFVNTAQEAPRRMAAFEGAVDELDRRGLVDRDRVGLIGFSRTVFHVAFTLTHSNYKFRAATLADGFDGGYLGYLVWRSSDAVGVNDGKEPVGVGLKSWLQSAPAFNAVKTSAAVRLESYGPRSYLGNWEWYSVLTLLHKPVDFLWIPEGTHLLVKPWDRLTSEQGNVDWFRFWLSGQNTCPASDGETCARWRGFASSR
ncbi:MAG: hypothetical protein JSS69_16485 [Acidobacteria bacterium]|nr:hypothetical protein [Acidobacteriota bacterium]